MTTTHGSTEKTTGSRWPIAGADRLPYLLGLAGALFLAGAPSMLMTYAGLDPSWSLGLNEARAESFQFGRDAVFTYGPWGYLDHPAPVGSLQSLAALVYAVSAAAALYAAAFLALRRRWEVSPAVAAGTATALTAIFGTVVEASALAAVACGLFALVDAVSVAEGARRRGRVTALPVAIAAASGLLVQVKLSVGVAVALVAALSALGDLAGRRVLLDLVAAGAAGAVSFLSFWLLAGQDLGWLPEWVRGSVEIVAGYPGAMALERQDALLGYLLVLALAAYAVVLLVGLARRVGLRRALVPALLAGALLEFGFKAAFIRHDDHELVFFTVATAVLLAIAPLARHRTAAVAAVVSALLMMVPGLDWLDVRDARDAWRVSLQVALDGSAADSYDEQAKAGGRATYQLPEEFVSAVGDQPVAVDPYDAALAIDYDMNWHPWPVMQAYSAYTPFLDRLNARAARTAPADQVVLRLPTVTVDARNPVWETPEYVLTLACQYTQVLTNGSWSLLRHDDPRCGERREVGREALDAGETVDVPPAGPDELLVASFRPQGEGVLHRLSDVVLKDWTMLSVTADDQAFGMPESLAGGPLLVGYPDRGDEGVFPAFHYARLSFTEPGTVTFSSIPLAP
jgi:hypothetical protein